MQVTETSRSNEMACSTTTVTSKSCLTLNVLCSKFFVVFKNPRAAACNVCLYIPLNGPQNPVLQLTE